MTCVTLAVVVALCAVFVCARAGVSPCEVRARTEAGWACGRVRRAEDGAAYASFRGVPYANQPLGDRRFKELEPVDPWEGLYDATEEGPACYQTDVVYGRMLQPRGMSEACIHANIHVPLQALLHGGQRPTRGLHPPYTTGYEPGPAPTGLPILVFVHGGGFQGGSGDADLHGPDYLVSKGVIVITFNYRLNAFGFLSLNSPEIPGNQGLRDQVTLLRWVQRNAASFGGDPDNVTLMGQSAGAAAVHLLTLSKATKGLFKRAFIMSGTGAGSFFSPSPILAQQLSGIFLATLGINATDSAENIHRQLVRLPVEKIHEANRIMLDQFGLTTFVPTVEAEFPGVTRILDDDPEVLVARGRGKDVPLVIGFTNLECEVFRRRLDQFDIASKIIDNPIITVPPNVIFSTLPQFLPDIVKRIDRRYYNGTVTTDGFIKLCTDGFYKYPALKLAEKRATSAGAPVFLYEFAYDGEKSVLREALDLDYRGAAHIEDLTYVFRVNSMLPSVETIMQTYGFFPLKNRDAYMKDWMTTFLVNFMQCSEPVCNRPSVRLQTRSTRLQIQQIRGLSAYEPTDLTEEQQNILRFFDSLRQK